MPLEALHRLDPIPDGLAEMRDHLRSVIGVAIAAGAGRAWREEEFNRLALAVFRYQARANPIYDRFVHNRGIDPQTLDDWRGIPPVPTRAFKVLPLRCGPLGSTEATFLTSGTTLGSERRGAHHVRDLSLYRAAALTTAQHFLRMEAEDTTEAVENGHSEERSDMVDPTVAGNETSVADGMVATNDRGTEARATTRAQASKARVDHIRTKVRVLSLTPGPNDHPESSLVHMLGLWVREWDDGEGGFFASSDWRLRTREAIEAIERAGSQGVPVLLAGTAFAFVHWLDERAGSEPTALPTGSVVVETGGFKGRSRSVSRADLYAEISSAFEIPARRVVNEYGMTEMLSQFYEPVLLHHGPEAPGSRHHVGPPWVRTRVLDPHTLEPVAPGESGILCHLDLANLDSVAAILTEDTGAAVDEGFRLEGRMEGSEPRGCSLSMEELLTDPPA